MVAGNLFEAYEVMDKLKRESKPMSPHECRSQARATSKLLIKKPPVIFILNCVSSPVTNLVIATALQSSVSWLHELSGHQFYGCMGSPVINSVVATMSDTNFMAA